jgi:hypothetical protein
MRSAQTHLRRPNDGKFLCPAHRVVRFGCRRISGTQKSSPRRWVALWAYRLGRRRCSPHLSISLTHRYRPRSGSRNLRQPSGSNREASIRIVSSHETAARSTRSRPGRCPWPAFFARRYSVRFPDSRAASVGPGLSVLRPCRSDQPPPLASLGRRAGNHSGVRAARTPCPRPPEAARRTPL